MKQEKPLLDELASKGKPLAEVVVVPVDEQKSEEICEVLDSLSPDISAAILPAYFQSSETSIRYQIRLEATKEALLREFGWELDRIKIYDSEEDGGQHPDGYAWEEKNQPNFYPEPLNGEIKEMGLTQPGNSDNGSIDNVPYEI